MSEHEYEDYATFIDMVPGLTHLERLDLSLTWDLSADAARNVTHVAKTWQHGMSTDLSPVLYDRFIGLRKDIDDTMVEERDVLLRNNGENVLPLERRVIVAEARWTPTEVLLIPYLRERIKRKGPGTYEARLLLAEVKRTCDMRMCAAWLAPDVVALPATAHIATELERRMVHRQVFNPTVQRWLDWLPRCL